MGRAVSVFFHEQEVRRCSPRPTTFSLTLKNLKGDKFCNRVIQIAGLSRAPCGVLLFSSDRADYKFADHVMFNIRWLW
jgi:hypothetical protein